MEQALLEKINSKKIVAEAYNLAEDAHKGQQRKNGEDYILHLRRTGIILHEWGASDPIISAGYLHDVVEDKKISLDVIKGKFGERVAFLVDGVTKLPKEEDLTGQKTLEKIAKYSAKDLGVLLIKLADRIDNLESHAPAEWKREKYYKSTKEFLIPLAKSYGLNSIADELEKSLKELE